MALPIWGKFMDKVYKDVDLYGSKRPGTFKNPTESDLVLMECPFYIPEDYYDNGTTVIYDGGGNTPPQPNINPNNNKGGTTFIPRESTRGRVKVQPKSRRDQRKEERTREKERRKIERKKVAPKKNEKESIWKRLGKGFGIGRE